MTTVAEILAAYVYDLSFKELPKEVVTEAKYRIMDFIASALPAWKEPPVKIMLTWVRRQNTKSESTVIAYGDKVVAHYAALINGVMGHCLELDDTLPTVAHTSVVTVPPSLALAEREGLGGKELITSVVAGYEIACRVGIAATPTGILHDKGFHPTSVNGVFGATASACKILNLSEDKIATALGIAGSMASGLLECTRDGTWTKRLHPGWASHNGILAAEFAKMGYTAPSSIFEGRLGYLHAFIGESANQEKIIEDLGKFIYIFRPGYKLYASCKYNHAPINAVLRILEQHDIDPRDIQRVEVRMMRIPYLIVAEPIERKKNPTTQVEAQFSVYYAVAVTLIDKKPPLHEAFSPTRIKDREVLELARKVIAICDPELENEYNINAETTMDSIVTIVLKNGKRFTERNYKNFDHPPYKQLEDKFYECALFTLDKDRTEEALNMLKNLENLGNINELMEVLRCHT